MTKNILIKYLNNVEKKLVKNLKTIIWNELIGK